MNVKLIRNGIEEVDLFVGNLEESEIESLVDKIDIAQAEKLEKMLQNAQVIKIEVELVNPVSSNALDTAIQNKENFKNYILHIL